MQVFKIKKDGFNEIRKKVLLRAIPILLLAGAAGIIISFVNTSQKEDDVNVLPIVIPIIAASMGFGLFSGLKRQKALFESFTLTITNNLITREQLNTATISIYFNEIKEITKHKNGCFAIKGKDPADVIVVPLQIDNYFQLETALQQIQPIVEQHNVSFITKYQGLTGYIVVGLMICVYTVQNKIIIALTGIAVVTFMIWSFIKIRGSKNVDDKTKRNAWWGLFVLAAIIAFVIFKLTGLVDMQTNRAQ